MLIFSIIDVLFDVYTVMLFGRILGSWVPEFQSHKIMQFLAFYTDPYLNVFRRIIPPLGMIDISPIFAFLALNLIERGVDYLVYMMIR
jgi:YggT family protein